MTASSPTDSSKPCVLPTIAGEPNLRIVAPKLARQMPLPRLRVESTAETTLLDRRCEGQLGLGRALAIRRQEDRLAGVLCILPS